MDWGKIRTLLKPCYVHHLLPHCVFILTLSPSIFAYLHHLFSHAASSVPPLFLSLPACVQRSSWQRGLIGLPLIDWFLLNCPAEAKSLQTHICPIIWLLPRFQLSGQLMMFPLSHLRWRWGCSPTHWFIATYQVVPTHLRLPGTWRAWWWPEKWCWWNLSNGHMSTRLIVLSLIYNYRLCAEQLQPPIFYLESHFTTE